MKGDLKKACLKALYIFRVPYVVNFRVIINGKMAENMKANGIRTRCMVKGFCDGETGECIEETLLMISWKVKENTFMQMEGSLKELLKKESNMVKGTCLTEKEIKGKDYMRKGN